MEAAILVHSHCQMIFCLVRGAHTSFPGVKQETNSFFHYCEQTARQLGVHCDGFYRCNFLFVIEGFQSFPVIEIEIACRSIANALLHQITNLDLILEQFYRDRLNSRLLLLMAKPFVLGTPRSMGCSVATSNNCILPF